LQVLLGLLFVRLSFFVASLCEFIESYYIINADINGVTYSKHTKTH